MPVSLYALVSRLHQGLFSTQSSLAITASFRASHSPSSSPSSRPNKYGSDTRSSSIPSSSRPHSVLPQPLSFFLWAHITHNPLPPSPTVVCPPPRIGGPQRPQQGFGFGGLQRRSVVLGDLLRDGVRPLRGAGAGGQEQGQAAREGAPEPRGLRAGKARTPRLRPLLFGTARRMHRSLLSHRPVLPVRTLTGFDRGVSGVVQ